MRIKLTETDRPKIGEHRTVKLFLWWPRICGQEIRWLENAEIIQVFRPTWKDHPRQILRWFDESWADDVNPPNI